MDTLIQPELTTREVEIMKMIIKETQNREIAHKLHISIRTVETHRKNIFKKLQCNSAMSLLRWALKNGVELN